MVAITTHQPYLLSIDVSSATFIGTRIGNKNRGQRDADTGFLGIAQERASKQRHDRIASAAALTYGYAMHAAEDIRCQICDSHDCPPLIEHETDQGQWHYRRCAGCGLVFLSPMLDDGELAALYANPDSGGTRAYFRKEASKLRRARGRVRHLAGAMAGGAKGKLFLDIGCSGGFMTQAAMQAGFTAWGIDPDGDAVAHAEQYYPGASYRVGGLSEFADAYLSENQERFDAVYCSEVLEHVADANAFVAAIAKLMATGGVLYLTTPDIGHWRRPRKLADWDVFTPPHHCLFFSLGNLRQLLARHGLEIYHRQWAFKPGLKVLARKVGESI